MKRNAHTPVTQLVSALSARPGFAGLTPATRTLSGRCGRRTSQLIEKLLTRLDKPHGPARH